MMILADGTLEVTGWVELLKVGGAPVTFLIIAIIWWKAVGKDQAESNRKTLETNTLLTERLTVCTNRSEKLVTRGERVLERIEQKFPSKTWGADHERDPLHDTN
jgi:hypothetical protein